jgi:hypothetical protein
VDVGGLDDLLRLHRQGAKARGGYGRANEITAEHESSSDKILSHHTTVRSLVKASP